MLNLVGVDVLVNCFDGGWGGGKMIKDSLDCRLEDCDCGLKFEE